jgi:hypothetical protein
MGKAFWIGIIGGFFGILGGIIALMVGSISESFTSGSGGDVIGRGIAALAFSLIGMSGGVFETRKKIGVPLMAIAAIGVLFSTGMLGILSFIFFLIGAVLILTSKEKVLQVHVTERQWLPSSQYSNTQSQQYVSPGSQHEQADRGFGSKACVSCGVPIDQNAKYCSNCGTLQS